MRNPGSDPVRSAVRAVRRPVVMGGTTVGVLAVSSGTAVAEPVSYALRAEPNALTFGLLGPVGLAAVAFGVLGMAAGVVRQRRGRARAAAEARAQEEPDSGCHPVGHDTALVSVPRD
ncbi:hypothetical protein [Saccharomonospora saliphila]|uniref:hypothetical protein n=1 Tax=Saccharomonospora saliphila TaxID=369829 RepID=UPI00036AF106|nr:hypothetical protein [Saccharomonospora saliphila]